MTTLDGVAKKKGEQSAEAQAGVELVRLAQEQGLSLTGPDGLLKQLTKTVLETALEGEISHHLGYDRHDSSGRNGGNSRNGHRTKTVLTDLGPVEVDVPRDCEGRSSRRSCVSANAASTASTRSSFRCTPRG